MKNVKISSKLFLWIFFLIIVSIYNLDKKNSGSDGFIITHKKNGTIIYERPGFSKDTIVSNTTKTIK